MLAHVASATYPSSSPYLCLPRKVATFSVSILLSSLLGIRSLSPCALAGNATNANAMRLAVGVSYNDDKVGSKQCCIRFISRGGETVQSKWGRERESEEDRTRRSWSWTRRRYKVHSAQQRAQRIYYESVKLLIIRYAAPVRTQASCFAAVFVDHQPGERRTIVWTFLPSLIARLRLVLGPGPSLRVTTRERRTRVFRNSLILTLITRDSYVAPLEVTRDETGAAKQNKRSSVRRETRRVDGEDALLAGSFILKLTCLSNQWVNWCQNIKRITHTHTHAHDLLHLISTCRRKPENEESLLIIFHPLSTTTRGRRRSWINGGKWSKVIL